MEYTAEPVAAPDAVGKGRRGRRLCERERWSLLKRAVWTVLVVMADVGAHDLLEVAAAEDQKAVEAFASQAAHPALRMRLRFRCLYRRPNHPHTLGAEHLVEAARELAVAIADEETHRLLFEDSMNIYERARGEVLIPRSDGRQQRYAAVRYRQQIQAVEDNKQLLVTVIAGIIKKRTSGFDRLAEAGRPDLMLETLVLDTSKPYHRFFTQTTIETARKRMENLGFLSSSS